MINSIDNANDINLIGGQISVLSSILISQSAIAPADRLITPANTTQMDTILGNLLDYYETIIPAVALP